MRVVLSLRPGRRRKREGKLRGKGEESPRVHCVGSIPTCCEAYPLPSAVVDPEGKK